MIYEKMTDDECYLYALIMDESGIDLAEFCYIDETATDENGDRGDGCFRTWPFQYAWFRNKSQKHIDAASRSCGKSLSIKLRAFAFPFNYPGEEMLITAPEAIHLQAVTDNVESLYLRNKLANGMLAGQIKHRPFHINFAHGGRIMGRIPKLDGTGVQGMHPLILEQDEASSYPEAGWTEIKETIKMQNPRSRWRSHGVSFGLGGTFNEYISGENSNWAVTRLPAMYRPNWTDRERQEKIIEYHGYDSSGYRRNVLGLPASAGSPIFVLHRLMRAVDSNLGSTYNEAEYYHTLIDEAQIRDADGEIENLINIPSSHGNYKNFWIGMDLGWTLSPSSIAVFAEVNDPKKDKTSLKLMARILLRQVSPDDQVKAIIHLMDLYRPLVYALDATGAGFPLIDNLRNQVKQNAELAYMLDRIKDCQFSEKVIVGFDESIEIDQHNPDAFLDAAIKRPFIEASTDAIRILIDSERMTLPFDEELIHELQAAPEKGQKVGNNLDAYGRSGRKSGMHNLDAMRMAAFSYQTHFIDQLIENHKQIWTPPSMIMM